MSRIELQWQIDSGTIKRSDNEDPKSERARRRFLLRLALFLALVILLAIAASLALRQRMLDKQRELESLLRDTAQAEVASLRIGDINTWLGIQDGNDLAWRQHQQMTFQQYSQMKARGDIRLTGQIRELTVDRTRARVVIEEIIAGSVALKLWFYAFEDGAWRHVAPPADA